MYKHSTTVFPTLEFFDIAIDYIAGDSYDSRDYFGEPLGMITSNIEHAKENLRRIKIHYQNYMKTTPYEPEFLKFLTNAGERTIYPFWCGYHERLLGAKIIRVVEEDDEFSFRI